VETTGQLTIACHIEILLSIGNTKIIIY
jgi:hypothetical protein